MDCSSTTAGRETPGHEIRGAARSEAGTRVPEMQSTRAIHYALPRTTTDPDSITPIAGSGGMDTDHLAENTAGEPPRIFGVISILAQPFQSSTGPFTSCGRRRARVSAAMAAGIHKGAH